MKPPPPGSLRRPAVAPQAAPGAAPGARAIGQAQPGA